MAGTGKMPSLATPSKTAQPASIVDSTKRLLADPKDRIALDDYVTGLLRRTIDVLSSDAALQAAPAPTAETFKARLDRYDEIAKDLFEAVVLLARWGRGDQALLIGRILARLTEMNKSAGGYVAWTSGRFYPVSLLSYAAGITALCFGNYHALGAVFLTEIETERSDDRPGKLATVIADEMNQLSDVFKVLPDYAQKYVPRSEYMYAKLRGPLDDLLFLGSSYERLFDEYEIMSSLVYADLTAKDMDRVWAAPGRFGWKISRTNQPYTKIVARAETMGADWPLLKVGFFNSSSTRFQEIAKAYRATLARMNFH